MVSAADFTAVCNKAIRTKQCTPQTCCLEQGRMDYLPSLPGNVLYAVLFGLILLPNAFFTVRARTWSFGVWMSLGLIGEIVGYIGRIMLHQNIFSFNGFLVYLIPLTIAPAFVTASMYLCLSRIIYIVDPALQYTRLRPKMYTSIFVTFDFIALILQGAGGGITATADVDKAKSDRGIDIMMAGLGFQVFSLIVFSALCIDFAWRVRQGRRASIASADPMVVEDRYQALRATIQFRGLMWALAAATVLIIIRSVYRLAELQGGFHGKLANDEVVFMIIEGPMIILACSALVAFHPGLSLKGHWEMKDFESLSAQHGNVAEKDVLGGYGSSKDPSHVMIGSAQN
ncbi:hypothetical protein PG996_007859 [Apiospora saccharicola]|uniref:Uncharacterized protein n=1 Tax=Apiospora saccharicola TaxID=335842 RepID=A0ABR1UWC4_9PEZI